MRISKKLLVSVLSFLLVVGLSVNALAVYNSPAEAYASLTKTTLEEAIALRHSSQKPYGVLSEEAGLKPEFEAAMQELHKQKLDEMVKAGQISQEEADLFIKAMESCDGNDAAGKQLFKGSFGRGDGQGRNFNINGQANREGRGRNNAGFGNRDGRGRNNAQTNSCESCTECATVEVTAAPAN